MISRIDEGVPDGLQVRTVVLSSTSSRFMEIGKIDLGKYSDFDVESGEWFALWHALNASMTSTWTFESVKSLKLTISGFEED